MYIIFTTSNEAKIKIMEELLNKYDIKVISQKFDFDEIQDLNTDNVVAHKAKQIINKMNDIFIIEDS